MFARSELSTSSRSPGVAHFRPRPPGTNNSETDMNNRKSTELSSACEREREREKEREREQRESERERVRERERERKRKRKRKREVFELHLVILVSWNQCPCFHVRQSY